MVKIRAAKKVGNLACLFTRAIGNTRPHSSPQACYICSTSVSGIQVLAREGISISASTLQATITYS